MNNTLLQVAEGIEGAIALVGLWLLWRVILSPEAKKYLKPPALTFWAISAEKFFLSVWIVVVAAFLTAGAGSYVGPWLKLSSEMSNLIAGSSMHFGIIAGVIAANFLVLKPVPQPPKPHQTPAVLIGLGIFLMVMPIVSALSLFSDWLLTALHFPTEKQELVDLLLSSNSFAVKATIVVLAVFVAPIGEELIFRAGLFRYLKGRVPRWVALSVPAILFAALHVTSKNLNGLVAVIPLVGLAIFFSLAYERTGRISTTIIAHAVFNLNSAIFAIISAQSQ